MKLVNINTLNQKIRQSFNNKNFKYGGYASLITLIAFGMLIILNLLVDQIPLKLDWSKNQIFSLSKQTYQILDNLKQDVTIYGLYQAGKENTDITEILKKYRDHTNKIKLEFVDPNKNPGFAKKYTKDGESLSLGSLIVLSGNKFKVIKASDLVNFDYSNPYEPTATSLAVEQRVTGAIMYVNSGKNPVIYALEGHGEQPLPAEVVKQLETENYELKTVNLYTAPFPQDTDMLLVFSPQRDFTKAEVDKIRQFLEKQGRAFFMVDLLKGDLPNLQSLLRSYGVAFQQSLIVEGDNSRYVENRPLSLLPFLESHQILDQLKSDKMPVLIPFAQGIRILDVKKRSIEVEPLLTTSKAAWGKTNLNATTIDKTSADLSGPFNIAVAITDQPAAGNAGETKLVVVGNALFLSSDIINSIPGNANFFMNSLSWLQDRKVNLSIKPKSLLSMRLNINTFQTLLLSAFVVILIPLGVLGTGLMVWLRRRHL